MISTLDGGLHQAPHVASVGEDTNENFGIWRDADGRLVWGINDFDEASVMPYPCDLVRLATSALLAPRIDLTPVQTARAVARGYAAGWPTHVQRSSTSTRSTSVLSPKEMSPPTRNSGEESQSVPWRSRPKPYERPLENLPEAARVIRFGTRESGAGSLDRTALRRDCRVAVGHRRARGEGARAFGLDMGARQRQAEQGPGDTAGAPIARRRAFRAHGHWTVRRLAPDSRKLDFGDIERSGLTAHLLFRMAADIGAVHAADKRSADVQDHSLREGQSGCCPRRMRHGRRARGL